MAINTHNRRRALIGVLPHPDTVLDGVDLGYIWRHLWPEGIIIPPAGGYQYPVLEFAADNAGPYSVAGLLRTPHNVYRALALAEDDRSGQAEPLQDWTLQVSAIVLELNPVLLSSPAWYFRIYDPDEGGYYYLGFIYYQVEFDGLLNTNQIVYHRISLQRIADAIPELIPE